MRKEPAAMSSHRQTAGVAAWHLPKLKIRVTLLLKNKHIPMLHMCFGHASLLGPIPFWRFGLAGRIAAIQPAISNRSNA